jgi:hypothetical protein
MLEQASNLNYCLTFMLELELCLNGSNQVAAHVQTIFSKALKFIFSLISKLRISTVLWGKSLIIFTGFWEDHQEQVFPKKQKQLYSAKRHHLSNLNAKSSAFSALISVRLSVEGAILRPSFLFCWTAV